MIRIVVANQKGGVGKTTTAVNLVAALSLAGRKCLLVDLDAQGNATSALNCAKVDSYNLEGGLPLPVSTACSGIDLIPASGTYSSPGVATALVRAVGLGTPDGYDFIAMDCPPALNGVTRAAMKSATHIIVPIQCEYFSMEGLQGVSRAIANVKRQENPDLKMLGILLTMYEEDQDYCNEIGREVRKHFSGDVFDTVIPRTISLSEATSHGQPITVYAPKSAGCLGYVRLAKEVLDATDG